MTASKINILTSFLLVLTLPVGVGLYARDATSPPAALMRTDALGAPLPEGALARMGSNRLWHPGMVTALAFSPDDKMAASLDSTGTVRLWELPKGKEVDRIPNAVPKPPQPAQPNPAAGLPTTTVPILRFLPTGKHLAVGDGEQAVRLWDLATKQQHLEISGERGVLRFAFSPDGKTLATVGKEKVVRLWSVEDGRPDGQIKGHEGNITSIVYSRDGKTLVTSSDDHTVRLWDVDEKKERRRLSGHRHAVLEVVISADGKKAASSGLDRTFRFWDMDTGQEVRKVGWDGAPGGISPPVGPNDGEKMTEWERLALLLLPNDSMMFGMGLSGGARACSADGKQMISWYSTAYDTTTGQSAGGWLNLVEVSTGKSRWSLPGHPAAVQVLAWSPDGKLIVSGSMDQIILWDAATGKQLRQFRGHTGPVVALDFHPDGRLLASAAGFGDQTISLWDVETGKEVRRFHGKTDTSNGQQFFGFDSALGLKLSPDGKLLVSHRQRMDETGTVASVLEVWDVKEGKVVRELKGPHSVFAFTPDGATLMAVGYDRAGQIPGAPGPSPVIRRWDARTWKETTRNVPELGQVPGGLWGGRGVLSPDARLLAQLAPKGGVLGGNPGGVGGMPAQNTLGLWDITRGELKQSVGTGLGLGAVPTGGFGAFGFAGGGLNLGGGGIGGFAGALGALGAVGGFGGFPGGGLQFGIGGCVGVLGGFGGVSHQFASFAADGRSVTSFRTDGSISVWEVAGGGERCKLPGHPNGTVGVCFSPDGKRLASWGVDSTILVWDLDRLRDKGARNGPLSDKERDALWAALASEDAAKAYQAMCRLHTAPDQGVAFLKDRLKPAKGVDKERLARLIADLDSGQFQAREAAKKQLANLGPLIRPSLEKVLEDNPTLQVRRHVEELLERIRAQVWTVEQLREARAVEVLEKAATAEARELLGVLARDAPAAHLGRLAQEGLRRMDHPSGRIP